MQKVKKKVKTQSQLKKKLDEIFSKYIRQKYADKLSFVSCYTCGKRLPTNEMQNGHFIRRQYLATRYSEDNCRPQCVGCNIFGDGKTVEFARKLEEEKKGIVQELYKKAQEITKDYPYEKQIEHYKQKLKELDES
jgi:hypothetical protein